MIEILIFALCAIGVYITLEMIKYNKQLKEDERNNNRAFENLKKEKNKSNRGSKISKSKVQGKSKSVSSKKKTKTHQSIDELVLADPTVLDQIYKDFGIERKKKTNKSKVKKNARRDKKKV